MSAAGDAGRKGGFQTVHSLIMDRHWSPEEIDYISGSRVVAAASLSLPTILTGRSIAATLDLPGSGPEGQVRRHLRRKGKRIRSKRPKTRGKIEILHSVKERPKQADARSRLIEWADDTLVAAGPEPCQYNGQRNLRFLWFNPKSCGRMPAA